MGENKKVKIDLAPMEGLTTYSFRMLHSASYKGVDRYFTPFLVANETMHFQKREIREILPENNRALNLIPQILTRETDQLLWAMDKLASYGYHEINLNLGCPYPTVVRRKRGSGFLADTDYMDRFFDRVFEKLDPSLKLSVKTRIGIESTAEAEKILQVYNRYPICELIVHARLQKSMYSGKADLETFALFAENAVMPLTYNGDLFTTEDIEGVHKRFPNLERVMIGRGLLRDPALAERYLYGGEKINSGEDLLRLRTYMDEQYHAYKAYSQRSKEVLSNIKELWTHVGFRFPGCEDEILGIRKAWTRDEYNEAVNALFLKAGKGEKS